MTNDDESYLHHPDSCSGVYPPEEFEGLWVEHWPNGQLKFRGQYKKRRRKIGQHLCFWPNGVLEELSFWDEGYACGTVTWFREDGSKETERDFGVDGGRTRVWTERTYDDDNELYVVRVWHGNDIVEEWIEPETKRRWEELGIDKSAKEAVKEMYPEEYKEMYPDE